MRSRNGLQFFTICSALRGVIRPKLSLVGRLASCAPRGPGLCAQLAGKSAAQVDAITKRRFIVGSLAWVGP
jgi:hypothetical protein